MPVERVQYKRDHSMNTQAVNKAWIDALKVERGCADCGYNTHACALDFDHRPGETKVAPISSLRSCRRERILAEIAKCDVVCANCHRVRTFVGRLDVAS